MNRCDCPIEHSIGCLTNQTALASRAFLIRRFEQSGIDMTVEQFKVMVVLWKEGSSTQQEIADFVGKDKTSVTRLITGLEKRSLIRRCVDNADKRCNLVTLTPQGKHLEAPTMAVISDAIAELHRGIDPDDLAVTIRVLHTLCNTLTTLQKEPL